MVGAVSDVILKTIQALICSSFCAAYIQAKKKPLFVAAYGISVALSLMIIAILEIPIMIRGAWTMILEIGIPLLFTQIPYTATLIYVLMATALMFIFEIPFDFSFKYFFPNYVTMADLPQTVIWGANISFFALDALAYAISHLVCNKLLLKKSDTTMRYFIPFLVLQGILMVSAMVMSLTFSENYMMMLFVSAVILVVSFITDILLLRTFNKIQKAALSEAELQSTQMSLRSQVQYYHQLQDHMGAIRKIRHDIKNQLQTLRILLDDGEVEAAEKQLRLVERGVDETQIRRFTGNLIADAILDAKSRECERDGIALHVSGLIPVNLELEGTVICSVLANLLDNAIQACRELPSEEEKQIAIKFDYHHPVLAINCVNSIKDREEPLRRIGKKNAPALGDEHGWGLEIIREIAEQHEGGMDVRENASNVEVMLWLSAGHDESDGPETNTPTGSMRKV